MGWFRVSNIVMQIGSALAAAHAKGIVHRDMKPENCFRVKRDGDADFIKVLDFGIAKIVDTPTKKGGLSLTIEGGIIGTPEYIAPELCRGQKADGRVDIYALGIIMYRLLTGVVPFTRRERQLHGRAEPAPDRPRRARRGSWTPRSTPAQIEAIVLKALEKDPDRRYQKVEELIAALRDAQLTLTGASSTGILSGSRSITSARKVRAPARMPLPLLITLVAVLLIGAAAIVWALVGGSAVDDRELPPLIVAKKPAPVEAPIKPAPQAAASTSGGSDDGADEDAVLEPDPDPDPTPGRVPQTLAAADFKRTAALLQKGLKGKCPGLPGMSVGARVQVGPDGKVVRVVPEGSQAGSSFSTCVVQQIRKTRFKRSQKGGTHTATFKI
jgi:hypothetical protein